MFELAIATISATCSAVVGHLLERFVVKIVSLRFAIFSYEVPEIRSQGQ